MSKACAKTDNLKKAKNRQKIANIGTFSLDSRLTRAFQQPFDVCRKNSITPCYYINVMKKY